MVDGEWRGGGWGNPVDVRAQDAPAAMLSSRGGDSKVVASGPFAIPLVALAMPLLPGAFVGTLRESLSSLLFRLSLSDVVAPLFANACEGLSPFAIVGCL